MIDHQVTPIIQKKIGGKILWSLPHFVRLSTSILTDTYIFTFSSVAVLFTLVMDELLVEESRYGVNVKLERWWRALESNGFKISRTNTDYMNYNFSGDVKRGKNSYKN